MEEASALPRKEAEMLSLKNMASTTSNQSMNAEVGLLTRRATHSPIQALKPNKRSGYSTTDHPK